MLVHIKSGELYIYKCCLAHKWCHGDCGLTGLGGEGRGRDAFMASSSLIPPFLPLPGEEKANNVLLQVGGSGKCIVCLNAKKFFFLESTLASNMYR